MNKLLSFLSRLSIGCGKLPLAAAAVLILSARVTGMIEPPRKQPAAAATAPADSAIIDQVLAKRAPELGLTLRHQLAVAIAEEAARAGYDPLLILAIIDVESDFMEEAISSVGAKGLMQIRPTTLHFLAQKEGLRLSRDEVAADPALCVRLGIRYLRELHDRFGELDLALMAYNAGPTRLRQLQKNPAEMEPFRVYPALVRRDFRRFREGIGLGGDWALALRHSQAAPADAPLAP